MESRGSGQRLRQEKYVSLTHTVHLLSHRKKNLTVLVSSPGLFPPDQRLVTFWQAREGHSMELKEFAGQKWTLTSPHDCVDTLQTA